MPMTRPFFPEQPCQRTLPEREDLLGRFGLEMHGQLVELPN